MAFDFSGWLRQPSTITGIASLLGGGAALAESYLGGSATADAVAGGVAFSVMHLVVNDNSQAAADAQALAIDVTKGVANHTLEVAIPSILRDGIKLIGDLQPRAPLSADQVKAMVPQGGATAAADDARAIAAATALAGGLILGAPTS